VFYCCTSQKGIMGKLPHCDLRPGPIITTLLERDSARVHFSEFVRKGRICQVGAARGAMGGRVVKRAQSMPGHFYSYPFSPCPASPCHILGSPCYGSGLTVTLHRQSQQGTSQTETFASRLVMAGVDICTVQEWMGHKTIQVTMRYAHLAPALQLEAVERL
jgi:hypothetical protein